MRAPDHNFVAYSDAQWQQIDGLLAELGLADVDQSMPWWHFAIYHTAPTRTGLEQLARDTVEASQLRLVTAKQQLQEERERLAVLEQAFAALEVFDDTNYGIRARAALGDVIKRVQRRIDWLETQGDQRKESAHKQWRDEFWHTLAHLAKSISAAADRRVRAQHVREFIIACSAPVFPGETNDDAVAYFLKKGKTTR